jgi:predicted amidophosphoribosyltransferase
MIKMKQIKVLTTTDPWEIIIRDLRCSPPKEFALKINQSQICKICFHPKNDRQVKCKNHPGINDLTTKTSMIIGHYYVTDYSGNAINWFTDQLKKISEHPYKYSHDLFFHIMVYRIRQIGWDLNSIGFSTMVPTKNKQMFDLFKEISSYLNFFWIDPSEIFSLSIDSYRKQREKYIESKYEIKENLDQKIPSESKGVLIFDDVFHKGYTFGKIIRLLEETIPKFYLAVIGRTVPRTLPKSYHFPLN